MSSESKAPPNCIFFAKGYCKNGDACRFAHPELPVRSSSKPECKFFANGYCKNEAACRFAHAEPSSSKLECNICFESNIQVFALLQNCEHVFCMDCIKNWRNQEMTDLSLDAVFGCPCCRKESLYIVPSPRHLTSETKEKFIMGYISSKKTVPCSRFIAGYCKFNTN